MKSELKFLMLSILSALIVGGGTIILLHEAPAISESNDTMAFAEKQSLLREIAALRDEVGTLKHNLASMEERLTLASRTAESASTPSTLEGSRDDKISVGEATVTKIADAVEPPSENDAAPTEDVPPQRHVIAQVVEELREEERQKREEIRLERDLTRVKTAITRNAESLALSANQQDALYRIYSDNVIKRRELFRGFDPELATPEQEEDMRQKAEALRKEREAALQQMVDPDQYEKLREFERREGRRFGWSPRGDFPPGRRFGQ